MTRTGVSPRLGQHLPEPFVEIHPDDAEQVRRRRRRLRARRHRLRAMHPQGRGQRAAAARHAVRADPLERARPHPPRGSARWWRRSPIRFPASPRTRRRRPRSRPTNMSFAVSRCRARSWNCPPHAWWARVAVSGGYGYLLADNADLARWQSWLRSVAGDDLAEYRDFGGGVYRAASFAGRAHRDLPVRRSRRAMPAIGTWSRACSRRTRSSDDQRRMLLSGKSTDGLASAGPIVCACFGVGRTTICDAIAAGASSAAAIGAQLKAGTNCGSCIPELKRLIAQADMCRARAAINWTPRRTDHSAHSLDRRADDVLYGAPDPTDR